MNYRIPLRLDDGVWLFADIPSVEARRRVLRRTLAEAIDCTEGDIVIGRTANGKPMLKHPTDRLFFNTSHRDDIVLVALAWNRPVGVDLELLPCAGGDAVAGTFFSAGEKRWLSSAENGDGAAFARLWTAKEAVLKAAGTGIAQGLAEPDLAAALTPGRPLGGGDVRLHAAGGDFAIRWFPAATRRRNVMAARALALPPAPSCLA
ncbi:MAG: 4'-phosphopantetheinyl transferase superfamily protein [Magnetospirillum sp.]|nr:4'-phosphopantetheinyl transferase superfamily protein [Magnetospirillum sp.]